MYNQYLTYWQDVHKTACHTLYDLVIRHRGHAITQIHLLCFPLKKITNLALPAVMIGREMAHKVMDSTLLLQALEGNSQEAIVGVRGSIEVYIIIFF